MDNSTLKTGYSYHPDGYILVPMRGKHGQGKYAKIDPDDYPTVSSWIWYAGSGYARGERCERDNGARVRGQMHRLILNAPAGVITDHINGDRLDNRKANLRLTNHSVNNRNRRPRSPAAYKGIVLHQHTQRWQVRLSWRGRNWNLDSYEDPMEAARVYDSAALFVDPQMGAHALNFPETATPVAPWEIRRQALMSGRIKEKSSPFLGVLWKARNDAFQAYSTSADRTVYLGLYDSEEAAARAHDSYVLTIDPSAPVNFADSMPLGRDEIIAASLTARPVRQRPNITNKHGYKGVSYHRQSNRWVARISIRGERRKLGTFNTVEDAARAYDAALVEAGLEPVNF